MEAALLFAAAAFFVGWLLGYATRAYLSRRRRDKALIPFPYQSDLTIYGKDVMDFTVLGLRSM